MVKDDPLLKASVEMLLLVIPQCTESARSQSLTAFPTIPVMTLNPVLCISFECCMFENVLFSAPLT